MMGGNGGTIRWIYPAITWGGLAVVVAALHTYGSQAYYPMRDGVELASEFRAIKEQLKENKEQLKENTAEQRKTRKAVEDLLRFVETDKARAEGRREAARPPNPALSPRYEPGGYE